MNQAGRPAWPEIPGENTEINGVLPNLDWSWFEWQCKAYVSAFFLRWYRLQNSQYFCVFKYVRAVKQKVWNEAENRERDWGETLKIFFFSRLTRPTGVKGSRASRVRLYATLYRFLYWFWEKNRLFCSLEMIGLFALLSWSHDQLSVNMKTIRFWKILFSRNRKSILKLGNLWIFSRVSEK